MPVEQREQVTHVRWSQRATGGTPCLDGRRQPSLGGTSRMNREVHVRICGGLGVKFPGSTRPAGVDGQTIEHIEADLKNNLYKIWNRMSSGTYFPPAGCAPSPF